VALQSYAWYHLLALICPCHGAKIEPIITKSLNVDGWDGKWMEGTSRKAVISWTI
jgi:uncharacterized protein (DUF2132 family)